MRHPVRLSFLFKMNVTPPSHWTFDKSGASLQNYDARNADFAGQNSLKPHD